MLSAAEVKQLTNLGATNAGHSTPSQFPRPSWLLASRWQYNRLAHQLHQDLSGNGNTGSL